MSTKLTLRLDEGLINGAKKYAAREGRSVSELVAAYFKRLDATAVDVLTPKALPDKFRDQVIAEAQAL